MALLALNTGNDEQSLDVGSNATAWVMTGEPLDTHAIKVNGVEPALDDADELTGLDGVAVAGPLAVPGQSIAFVAVEDANNPVCR